MKKLENLFFGVPLVRIMKQVATQMATQGDRETSLCLAAIADSLTRLEQLLASRLSSADPLWYMNILENAYKSNWILSTEEVEKLIGVKPRCDAGKDYFHQECWVFIQAGKMGCQTA